MERICHHRVTRRESERGFTVGVASCAEHKISMARAIDNLEVGRLMEEDAAKEEEKR